MAHTRQKLKDKGFKIPNVATGFVGKQTAKTRARVSDDEKAANKYNKKVQAIMQRVGLA